MPIEEYAIDSITPPPDLYSDINAFVRASVNEIEESFVERETPHQPEQVGTRLPTNLKNEVWNSYIVSLRTKIKSALLDREYGGRPNITVDKSKYVLGISSENSNVTLTDDTILIGEYDPIEVDFELPLSVYESVANLVLVLENETEGKLKLFHDEDGSREQDTPDSILESVDNLFTAEPTISEYLTAIEPAQISPELILFLYEKKPAYLSGSRDPILPPLSSLDNSINRVSMEIGGVLYYHNYVEEQAQEVAAYEEIVEEYQHELGLLLGYPDSAVEQFTDVSAPPALFKLYIQYMDGKVSKERVEKILNLYYIPGYSDEDIEEAVADAEQLEEVIKRAENDYGLNRDQLSRYGREVVPRENLADWDELKTK